MVSRRHLRWTVATPHDRRAWDMASATTHKYQAAHGRRCMLATRDHQGTVPRGSASPLSACRSVGRKSEIRWMANWRQSRSKTPRAESTRTEIELASVSATETATVPGNGPARGPPWTRWTRTQKREARNRRRLSWKKAGTRAIECPVPSCAGLDLALRAGGCLPQWHRWGPRRTAAAGTGHRSRPPESPDRPRRAEGHGPELLPILCPRTPLRPCLHAAREREGSAMRRAGTQVGRRSGSRAATNEFVDDV